MRKRRFTFVLLLVLGFGAATWCVQQIEMRGRRAQIQTLALKAYSGDTHAAAALKQLGSNAVPEFLEQAQYRITPERKAFQKKVLQLPNPIGRVVGPIIGLPDDVKIREAAARAFGTMEYKAEDAIPILIYLLGDPEGNVRWEAAKSLATIGPVAVPPLTEILEERTNAMRGMVIYTLGLIGPEADSTVPALVPHLTDPDEQVRNQTANTLLQLGPQAVVTLANLSANGNALERQAAQELLRRMASSPHSPILMLKQLATNSNASNRERAMEALGNLRPIASLSVRMLTNALADESVSVRLTAIRSLEKLGPRAAGALPELELRLNDPDELVRAAAKKLIETMSVAPKPD